MVAPAYRPAEKDPWDWSAVIAVFFLALVWHRLGIPSLIYFDEIHYVPAARKLLQLLSNNPEHPPFGKEIIAAAIALIGDKPLYWRIPSALFGGLGLYAFGRLMWFASQSRFAALSGMFLLATSFAWFVQSRIAMLDMFMASLAMVALWMFAAAMRHPAQGRWRLAIAGLCLGLSLASKWSVAPIAVLPGLLFLVLKIRDNGWRFAFARAGGPVPGISLIEAALWLGLLPLAVYWATYLPTFFYSDRPVDPLGIVAHHRYMLDLQDSVRKLHPYRSVWYQWVGNWRAIWYLYQEADGAQRGVLLIGNPFTMLAGLTAVLWCLWAGFRRNRAALAMATIYLVQIAFWIATTKPIQFYYHYLLPGTFLMACLALALDAMQRRGGYWRWASWGSLALAGGMFVYFYPILSAAKLHGGKMAYAQWMWLASWR
ncbi:MAG: phospholipid carrier-dependent glycosyltransferase [Novosphingobium sp.]